MSTNTSSRRSEQGQGAVAYILIICIVVFVFFTIVWPFINAAAKALNTGTLINCLQVACQ
jgi:hypothetical protein